MNIEKPWKRAWKSLLKNKLATAAFLFLILMFFIVVFAPLLAPYAPEETDLQARLVPGFWAGEASKGHLLGSDHLGRDILSRLMYGGRISLSVGFGATLIGMVFGTTFGLLAGFYKRLDNIIMRIMDMMFSFPGILLALLIIAMLGVSTMNAMLAIAVWSIPNFARMVRSRVLSIKEEDYIMAVRSLGASDVRILCRHVLTNCIPVIIVVATMRIASSIMSIATLSFLGLGTPPPTPEWGGMIASAKDYMWEQPSLIIIPGIVVMLCVISFNVLGDKLRDILDPSLKDS